MNQTDIRSKVKVLLDKRKDSANEISLKQPNLKECQSTHLLVREFDQIHSKVRKKLLYMISRVIIENLYHEYAKYELFR